MAVFVGPFDPLQLVFNLMNSLLKRGILTYDDARQILLDSLNPGLKEEEKEKIVNDLLKRVP